MGSTLTSFLLYCLKRLRKGILIDAGLIIAGETCGRLATYFIATLIGMMAATSVDRQTLVFSGVLLLLLFFITAALRGIVVNAIIYNNGFYIPRFLSVLSKNCLTIAHKQSPAFFELEMSGRISNKIDTMMYAVEHSYYTLIWSVIAPTLFLLINFIAIWWISPGLSILLLVLILLSLYMMYRNSLIIIKYVRESVKKSSLANGHLVDSLINAETVKSFGSAPTESRHYFQALKAQAFAQQKEQSVTAWLFMAQHVFRTFIQFILCLLPLIYWYYGWISVTGFVFIQSCMVVIIYQFNTFTDEFLDMARYYGQIKEAWELLMRPNQVLDKPNAKDLVLKKGAIDFTNIRYAYGKGKPLFTNFNLKIKGKERLGLVGKSGSGKSTLVKLMCRYYDVTKGSISIDGQDIRTVRLDSLYRQIAMIPQDPSLFNRTIMENIRYGKLDATDEEVYAAAKKAYCHEFIMALPKGYESKVGERGVMLSGGERQRIAIARAILKDAPILILDEATSALDSESELYIQKSLKNLMKGKTVIAIAHRLSTLKEMDKIVVLDKGKIVEQGTHATLSKQKGIYKTFYDLQNM